MDGDGRGDAASVGPTAPRGRASGKGRRRPSTTTTTRFDRVSVVSAPARGDSASVRSGYTGRAASPTQTTGTRTPRPGQARGREAAGRAGCGSGTAGRDEGTRRRWRVRLRRLVGPLDVGDEFAVATTPSGRIPPRKARTGASPCASVTPRCGHAMASKRTRCATTACPRRRSRRGGRRSVAASMRAFR